GIQGIRSHSRRAAAPSSSPANTRADSSEQKFFDKLNGSPLSGLPLQSDKKICGADQSVT
ncbi:hypothetical protein B5F19_06870, partial [Pseudoflavonifractor sp. An184]